MMFAPPLPQDGETVHCVNHKRTIKEGAVPADPLFLVVHTLPRHLDAISKRYSVQHVSMAY